MSIFRVTAEAIIRAVRLGLDGLRADPPRPLSEWAAESFQLAGESSHQRGSWESWPFQIGPMDWMSDDRIEELNLRKSKRVGFALALDTPIPTPSGWSKMGDLKPGDEVFDEQGKPTQVLYCSPTYADHNCFKVTFCDGTEVVADEGHRWKVETRQSLAYIKGELGKGRTGHPKKGQNTSKVGIVDTGELFKYQRDGAGLTAFAVRSAKPLALEPADLIIPPYTLGLWLGDGHLVSPRITQHRSDVESAEYIRAEGISVSVVYIDARYPDNATLLLDVPEGARPVSPWAKVFRAAGLTKEKRIPPQYLRASFDQRLQLLRGLMDSDGTVSHDGRCEFNNTNENLARGVYELLASFGIKASFRGRRRTYAHRLDQFRVNFKPTPEVNPFNLKRKAARVLEALRPGITHRRRIVSVERVEPVPVRCIQVAGESSLFLCSRAMIPTHNTKMLVAYMMYCVAHRRRKVALWQPTDDDRDSFVKTEIDPVLESIEAVKKSRKSYGNAKDTMAFKAFRNAVLHILGAKAARAFRRITVDVALLDEWDGMDAKVEKSADPATLAKGRLEGAPYPKFIGGTTPRIKNLSHVETAEKNANVQMRYHITCKHCGVEHPLIFGGKELQHGLKWAKGDPESVHHVCPHCRESITQADYMVAGKCVSGVWVCTVTGARYGDDRIWRNAEGHEIRAPRHVAAHIWAAYSPQRTWVSIARECSEAAITLRAGDDAKMQGFVNETLGETWELLGARSDEHALLRRARLETYSRKTVPVGALEIEIAIDTQDDRLEWAAWGFGEGLESWLIDWGEVQGNPALLETWQALDQHIHQQWPKQWDGRGLGYRCVGADTQGHHTQAVYNYVRPRQASGFFALYGGNKENLPLMGRAFPTDVTWQGKTFKNGVKRWEVGVDTAKDLFHAQLQIQQHGPGYVHLPNDVTLEVCEQLTAEQRIQKATSGGLKFVWEKRRARNEQLDMRNYAVFLAYSRHLHLRTPAWWAKKRLAVQPNKVIDDQGVETAPIVVETPAPRRAAPAKPAFGRQW